jgi:SAM-dependent methyltransferase
MDAEAMDPHGTAMLAFFHGDTNAELSVRRDDGLEDSIPVRRFFRDASEFTAIEKAVLDRCRGHVLDVGAGSGLHSMVLQEKGRPVTSIDISPHAVEIMIKRGVEDAHCADVFEFQGGPFDTILLLGRGIGMVETIAGLDRFLTHVQGLVSKDGQVLLDSVDVRATDDPRHLAYHESNRKAGRYVGENRLQFHFQGKKGPNCCWLHVDADTLKERAEAAGWTCDVILQEESGDYLAKLTR